MRISSLLSPEMKFSRRQAKKIFKKGHCRSSTVCDGTHSGKFPTSQLLIIDKPQWTELSLINCSRGERRIGLDLYRRFFLLQKRYKVIKA